MRLVKVRQLFPKWMRLFLRVCAAYHVGWAIILLILKDNYVKWITDSYTSGFFQIELHAIGLFVLGLIFILTSFFPIRFWYLIAFGFVAKTFGGIAVYYSIMDQTVTIQFIIHLLMNDLSWAVVLGIITHEAFSLYKLVD